ncbi:MAG: pyridoxamine 5'-phosphate oxidase [Gammaproteobacteria bacterium]
MLDKALPDNPMPMFSTWLDESWTSADTPNPNGMAITSATVKDGVAYPSTRVVLLKDANFDSGFVVFYTNYQSRKGRELLGNSRASALIHWDKLGRQVRLEGVIVKSPEEESDTYFATRHRSSRIGAWTSAQSEPVDSRETLLANLHATEKRFEDQEVPRPPHWGGLRLWIDRIELWCDGEFRLHDRAIWQRNLDDSTTPTSGDAWRVTRLQP